MKTASNWVKVMVSLVLISFVFLIVYKFAKVSLLGDVDYYDDNCHEHRGIGLSVANLVRLRKFVAEEHKVITADGFIIKLVRVLNPLINSGKRGIEGKPPIMFVHGEYGTAALFLMDSLDIHEPRDLSGETEYLRNSTVKQLVDRYKHEPTARSLVFFAAAFGREIWLLNRRGTPESQGYIDSSVRPYNVHHPSIIGDNKLSPKVSAGCRACKATKSNTSEGDEDSLRAQKGCLRPLDDLKLILNSYAAEEVGRRYWKYSLDEQAKYDVSAGMDYVLNFTGSAKLALVGHSTGSAIIMMNLLVRPESADKVTNVLHWAPSIFQAHSTDPNKLISFAIQDALKEYDGPFSLPTTNDQVQCLANKATERIFGSKALVPSSPPPKSVVGNDPRIVPFYESISGKRVSARQIVQVAQIKSKGIMHFYDFGNPLENLKRYDQPDAPAYNVSRLNATNFSFWRGKDDETATPVDVSKLIKDIGGRVQDHFYDSPEIYFNHQSPLFHTDIASLMIIPGMKEIESHNN